MIRHHAILHFAMADDWTSEGGFHGAQNEVERPMKNARARSIRHFVVPERLPCRSSRLNCCHSLLVERLHIGWVLTLHDMLAPATSARQTSVSL